jgi:hypothetical protein
MKIRPVGATFFHADGRTDKDVTNTMVALRSFSEHTHNFYVLLARCIYVFCMDLRISTNYFDVEL